MGGAPLHGVDAFGDPACQQWDDGIDWVAWRREHMDTRLSEEVEGMSNAEERVVIPEDLNAKQRLAHDARQKRVYRRHKEQSRLHA